MEKYRIIKKGDLFIVKKRVLFLWVYLRDHDGKFIYSYSAGGAVDELITWFKNCEVSKIKFIGANK
jgi:hypothetical protein